MLGDIWSGLDQTDWIVFPANSFVKKDGTLVMGAGFAKQVSERYPKVKEIFGSEIINTCGHLGEYNILYWKKIIALQTKYYFKENSDIELIRRSTIELKNFINQQLYKKVDMAFPGIGLGKLDPEQVYNYCLKEIDNLPNYTIWINKPIRINGKYIS